MTAMTTKDKLIEEAQKYALKGQFDKAASTYERLLAADPGAMNLRQKRAEFLVKCGKYDDARKELEIVGRHFSRNSFFLKAIAVYKQLQKLFPDDISLSLTLAELNQKHGLKANALTEYRLVRDHYTKNGDHAKAHGILGRMHLADPANVSVKIAYAESCAVQGIVEEAFALFTQIAMLLLERNDHETLNQVCTRGQILLPAHPELLLDVLAQLAQQEQGGIILGSLHAILRKNPHNKRAWDLIISAYQQLKQPQQLRTAYQHYVRFFPEEPEPLIGLITCIIEEGNITEAFGLIEKHEAFLLGRHYFSQLEQLYGTLDKRDPLNINILQGLARVASAAGNDAEAQALASQRNLLQVFSGDGAFPPLWSEEENRDIPLDATALSDFANETIINEADATYDLPAETADNSEAPHTQQEDGEDSEIEIDLDLESIFGTSESDCSPVDMPDNWTETVDQLFGAIATAPRSVKFSSGLEGSDARTHFELGQAFREMGLFDEAINEFRQASVDAERRLECLIMQCSCLRERGEVEAAITMLTALLKPGLSVDETCAVKYELMVGYETTGRKAEAQLLRTEIYGINPNFRESDSSLNPAELSNTLDISEDDLQDF